MNDFRINHIRNKGEIVSLYDLLLKFMARIYMSTNGKYISKMEIDRRA